MITRICPICRKDFRHRNMLNKNRANLTCSEKCHQAQRTIRQRERRLRNRKRRLREAHKSQVKQMFTAARKWDRTKAARAQARREAA